MISYMIPRYAETSLLLFDHQTHLLAGRGDYIDAELSLRMLEIGFDGSLVPVGRDGSTSCVQRLDGSAAVVAFDQRCIVVPHQGR